MTSKEYRIFCRHKHLAPITNNEKINYFVINNDNKIKKLKKVDF